MKPKDKRFKEDFIHVLKWAEKTFDFLLLLLITTIVTRNLEKQ